MDMTFLLVDVLLARCQEISSLKYENEMQFFYILFMLFPEVKYENLPLKTYHLENLACVLIKQF